MTLRRFFIPPEGVEGDRIRLDGDLLRHIRKVLRLGTGDQILLLDGVGNHYLGQINELTPGSGQALIIEQWFEREKNLPVRLIQSLPKGEKMELILQKGCELGVNRFSPVFSERSVPEFDQGRGEKKLQRWRKIIAEAARQCRRPILPICDPVQEFGQVISTCREELKLMLWEDGSVALVERLPEKRPAGVAVLVGSEGGFGRDEVDRAKAAGFLPVSLGPRILRAETSGFAVTAVLEYLYGDFGSDENSRG